MEIRFCPQCGTARQGAFCGGCGFHFESLSAAAAGGTAPVSAQPVDITEVAQPTFPIPFGMTYGEAFDHTRDCWNCGTESEAGDCELCGFTRP